MKKEFGEIITSGVDESVVRLHQTRTELKSLLDKESVKWEGDVELNKLSGEELLAYGEFINCKCRLQHIDQLLHYMSGSYGYCSYEYDYEGNLKLREGVK